MVIDERQSFDPITRDITATIVFSEVPDLTPGAMSFGYFIGFRPDVIARYEFAFIGGDPDLPLGHIAARYGIAYRPPLPGTLADALPYTLDGTTLSFTIPGYFGEPPIGLSRGAPYTLVTFAPDGTITGTPIEGFLGIGVPIPEPGSVVMAGLGVVGVALGLIRRRRRS